MSRLLPRETLAAALSVDDFLPLTTLSSPGPFQSVQLVTPSHKLATIPTALYILKSVERRWGFRMRQQQSPREELKILRLSLADSNAPIPLLIASFLSPTHFHLVLSHAAGGDLWALLKRENARVREGEPRVGLEEMYVQRWMAELVEALEWLHGKGWAHRDIKPQNVLLTSRGRLLLTDFGSAAQVGKDGAVANKFAVALVGTPDYIAPEVLLNAERVVEDSFEGEEEDGGGGALDPEGRAYGVEVDWWGFGVVMYELLFGDTPFFTESIPGTYERIVNWKETLAFPSRTTVSPSAQNLIRQLLTDAPHRLSPPSLKLQPWLTVIPWGSLPLIDPLFTPPPFQPPSLEFCSPPPPSGGGPFDVSAFFASPGLSILRPSPAAGEEEARYWSGVEHVPRFPLSLQPLVDVGTGAGRAKSAVDRVKAKAFETPTRGGGGGAVGGVGQGGSSGGRGRRGVSDVEAWKEMQEHAWEVGVTARKSRKGAGRARELDGLERRRLDVLDELDGLEEKYRGLFELAGGRGMEEGV